MWSPGELGPARPKVITAHLFSTLPIGYCSLEATSSSANNPSVRPTHLSEAQESGTGASLLTLHSRHRCTPRPAFHGARGCVSGCRLLLSCLPLLRKRSKSEGGRFLGWGCRNQKNWTGQCQCRDERRHSSPNAPKTYKHKGISSTSQR